jgi:hypothetical protein
VFGPILFKKLINDTTKQLVVVYVSERVTVFIGCGAVFSLVYVQRKRGTHTHKHRLTQHTLCPLGSIIHFSNTHYELITSNHNVVYWT